MLKKARFKVLNLVMASLVVLILFNTPTAPTVFAGDCQGSSSCG